MKQLFIYLFSLLALIPSLGQADEKFAWEDLKIQKLMPEFLMYPAIDPYLPEDFIAVLDNETRLFWGPKEVLDPFVESGFTDLKSAVIRACIGSNMAQNDDASFVGEDELEKSSLSMGFEDLKINKWKWGTHPVIGLSGRLGKQEGHLAWIGLNDHSMVLLVNLQLPAGQEKPTDNELKLWTDFLTKTKALDEYNFIKAHGQDLREGYTLVNMHGSALKFTAEQRESDGRIRVLVESNDDQTSCLLKSFLHGTMGLKWHQGDPLVKLDSTLVNKRGNSHSIVETVVSVLLKKVSSFSDVPSGPYKELKNEELNFAVFNFCP